MKSKDLAILVKGIAPVIGEKLSEQTKRIATLDARLVALEQRIKEQDVLILELQAQRAAVGT